MIIRDRFPFGNAILIDFNPSPFQRSTTCANRITFESKRNHTRT